MKKYLYLLCLLCLFSASGCGADQKDTSDPIPNVLAMDDLSDAQASALLLGYSMGEAHTEMQTSPAWQGTYDEERTLVLDGEQGQNGITLSVQAPTSAIYRIYLPEGTVFDDGTRLELMNKPTMIDDAKVPERTGYAHIAFSVGSKEAVDTLTARLRADGYAVVSGPRTTGDGYYESCILAVEDNQIEITV